MELTRHNLEDYLTGAKVLACGGGGSVASARQRIAEVYDTDGVFTLVGLQDVPDDGLLFIVGSVGGGVSEDARASVAGLPIMKEDPLVVAAHRLVRALDQEPFGVIASEIGPGNGVAPMYVASRLGIVTVDGDCCGRAKPEIAISMTNLAGLSITPMAIVSPFGDAMMLESAVDDERAEAIARHIAVSSGGIVGVARCPALGAAYRTAVLDGSVSRCIRLGKTIHEAQVSGESTVDALIHVTEGVRLFTGVVSRIERTDAGGFVTGNLEIVEIADKTRPTLRIWYKNEYLAAWLDGIPIATSPDLICVVDTETGEGLTPWENELVHGRGVTVVGIPADPRWHTKEGVALFGPSHFGLEMDYVPIEKHFSNLHEARK